MKKTIRISESQLKHIIKESVKRVLRENEQNLSWVKPEDLELLTKMESMENEGIADISIEESSFDGRSSAELLFLCVPLFDETEMPNVTIKLELDVNNDDYYEDYGFYADKISVGSSDTYIDYRVFEKQFPRISFHIEEFVKKLRYPDYDGGEPDFGDPDYDDPRADYHNDYR